MTTKKTATKTTKKAAPASKLAVTPYLNFAGKAREAMGFYKKILGGTLELYTMNTKTGTFSPAGPKDGIMHAVLTADGAVVMGSDGMPQYPAKVGDNFALALAGTDAKRLTKVFNALAEGGFVKQPLMASPWGSSFGWLQDKYAINWMINIDKA